MVTLDETMMYGGVAGTASPLTALIHWWNFVKTLLKIVSAISASVCSEVKHSS